jgi:hypothetical protein
MVLANQRSMSLHLIFQFYFYRAPIQASSSNLELYPGLTVSSNNWVISNISKVEEPELCNIEKNQPFQNFSSCLPIENIKYNYFYLEKNGLKTYFSYQLN